MNVSLYFPSSADSPINLTEILSSSFTRIVIGPFFTGEEYKHFSCLLFIDNY